MKSNTSSRLKEIMRMRGLRQSDILDLCKPYCDKYGEKLGSNALSQYVTGKFLPGQRKLHILGLALGVSETWLMGLDVPMEREDDLPEGTAEQNRTEDDARLLDAFHKLSEEQRKTVLALVESM
ncbi:MAG: hypothetical protein J5958_06755 [Clostridia bacterium]|nr:hypothetical protein [Clostridia bacterium]